MPEKVLVDQISNHQGTFTLEPLEPGYGHTIGNAMRRVLLSSLEGYAIVAIKFNQPADVLHEFATIKGVVEDLSEIILNLKQVRFKKVGSLDRDKLVVQVKNKKILTAGDLSKATTAFKILNPELVICQMDESTSLEFELSVQKGRGYLPAEENKSVTQIVGNIDIDAIFTPVRNVKYKVENTLVEQRTDYEKVIIEIKTDGSITPIKALQDAAKNLVSHFSLLIDKSIIPQEDYEAEKVLDEETLRIQTELSTSLRKLNLSSRAYNSLYSNGVKSLADLVQLTLPQLMKFRNFGKKSVVEVKELLAAKKLSFGMDISAYKIEGEYY